MIPTFKLKNAAPGYRPPETWDEFAGLERPDRIIAARYFLRAAACRLQGWSFSPDDIVNAFEGAREWVVRQMNQYRRDVAELRKTWVCRDEDCGYRGEKHEFFTHLDQLNLLEEVPMARCPKCGMCDCAVEEEEKKESQEESGGGKAAEDDAEEPCDCEGSCPVCYVLGEEGEVKDHYCERCNTTYCSTCHGIKEAQLSRAYDGAQRCKC